MARRPLREGPSLPGEDIFTERRPRRPAWCILTLPAPHSEREHMQISAMHWQQVEEYLRHDDRAVLPLGSTEQHAFLSLSTDSILAERMAADAAAPLGIPVFPVLAYGLTPYFRAYP